MGNEQKRQNECNQERLTETEPRGINYHESTRQRDEKRRMRRGRGKKKKVVVIRCTILE